MNSSGAMSEASRLEVRAGLQSSLARLWRYALVLSKARDAADDLVQATCLRAIERADQFIPGTRIDRWLFAILRSIWLNEIRSQRIREGGGFVDAEDALISDGVREMETNITASTVLRASVGCQRPNARQFCWYMPRGTVTLRRRPPLECRSARS